MIKRLGPYLQEAYKFELEISKIAIKHILRLISGSTNKVLNSSSSLRVLETATTTTKLSVSQIIKKKNSIWEVQVKSHSFGSRERWFVSMQADQGSLNFAIY